jgi:protein-tyrosine-phosphatase
MNKTRVLFLCTHNSARSQMAEGLLRAMAGDRFEVASAGTEATYVRPQAIAVMTEAGGEAPALELPRSLPGDRHRGREACGVPSGARRDRRAPD